MTNNQFNLFDLFNGNGMGSFEEVAPAAKESKPTKSSKKTKEEVVEETMDDMEEVDEEEDLGEELEEDVSETKKPAATNNTSKGGKKKKNNLTGKTEVVLPVTCYGRNWKHTIDGFGVKTINDIMKDLYDAGIVEVAHNEVNPISNEKHLKDQKLFFTSPRKESKSNVSIFSGEANAVICDGFEQMPLSVDMFDGKDAEEVTVLDAQFAFEKGFPTYQNLGLSYCSASKIGVPVLPKALTKTDKVSLPKDIVIAGERQPVKMGLFESEPMEVTTEEIIKTYFDGVDVSLYCVNDTLYCEYTGTAISSLTKPGKKGDGKEVVAKELYKLPCKCYFVTLNQTFEFTPEMFGGKEKVGEEEVLELLRKTYSLLRNRDRKVEVVYVREQNLVSVALTSGTKGSAYALPETESFGLFKMIRTVEELQEVKKLQSFLGTFVPQNGPAQRIEVCPHAIYTAIMGEGRELTKIKDIDFELKGPKIPYNLFQGIVEDFKAHPNIERIVQICWNEDKKEYYLSFPSYEESGKAFIKYAFKPVPPIVTIHSHNTMPAYFSSVDDRDEAITGVYGVIGNVHKKPTFKFRVGMEGSFKELELSEIFEEV